MTATGDAALIDAILDDWRTAPIGKRLRAALELLEVVTLRPSKLVAEDIDKARKVGLSDLAIREALYVCFTFNVMDRLADSFDFPISPKKNEARIGRIIYWGGYRLSSVPGWRETKAKR